MDRQSLKMMPIGNPAIGSKHERVLHDPVSIGAVVSAVSTIGGGIMQYQDMKSQKKEESN